MKKSQPITRPTLSTINGKDTKKQLINQIKSFFADLIHPIDKAQLSLFKDLIGGRER